MAAVVVARGRRGPTVLMVVLAAAEPRAALELLVPAVVVEVRARAAPVS
jgi:hypothetical protein